jgi:hypothetical protein
MPIRYAVDDARRVIRTVGTGDVTPDEVASHLEALAGCLSREGQFDVLLDLGACTSLPSSDQLRRVVTDLSRLGGRHRFARCAIVARSDALFGMTRMFEVFARDQFEETRTFRETEEAERWLAHGGAQLRRDPPCS